MSLDPPTEGSKRCMIYRHQRTLDDGCDYCGKSKTYCDGRWASDDETGCCNNCDISSRDPH